jgi:flagellar motor switch protein FliM
MNAKSKPMSPASPEVLDPCHLGRPVHLLPTFCNALRDDLSELFRTGMNRRYRSSFQAGEAGMAEAESPSQAGRWWTYSTRVGCIGLALDRSVVLAALHYRYGGHTATAAGAPAADAPVRETATEERLAALLGLQFVGMLAARIDAGLGAAAVPHDFEAATACPPPPAGTPTLRIAIEERTLGVQGALRFTLDAAWMARLLHRLLAARTREPAPGDRPLAARLQLTLAGRLLRKEMSLGELADLRVGDVIPVSLGATEVVVDDSLLFRAAVAERSGKLCLTSFEDTE